MRKSPATHSNLEEAFSLATAERLIANLIERVARLEEQLNFDSLTAMPIAKSTRTPIAKRGRGRPAKLATDTLLKRRDSLANWLESHWPYLSRALRNPSGPETAIGAILEAKKRLPGVFLPPFHNDPVKFQNELWSFLKSGRFHGNPRTLAAAMAGLPEMASKTSIDICSAVPSKLMVHNNAIWDYLRRYFPERWRELREVTTPEQVKAVLDKSQTKDPTYKLLKKHSKDHPEVVLEWFKDGNPALHRGPVLGEGGFEDDHCRN